MTQIIEKKELSLGIKSLILLSPLTSRKSKPGQFVVLRVTDKGERIPLTIADTDSKKGTSARYNRNMNANWRIN